MLCYRHCCFPLPCTETCMYIFPCCISSARIHIYINMYEICIRFPQVFFFFLTNRPLQTLSMRGKGEEKKGAANRHLCFSFFLVFWFWSYARPVHPTGKSREGS